MSEPGNTETSGNRSLWQRIFKRDGGADLPSRHAETAQRLNLELAKHPDNGALILTIGKAATQLIADQANKFTSEDSGLVFGKMKNSPDAESVYSEFRRINPQSRVVLVVDEDLAKDPIRNGIEAAKRIVDSTEEGSEKPKVMMIANVKRDIKTDHTRHLSWRMQDSIGESAIGSIPMSNLTNLLPVAFESLERNITFEEAMNEHSERRRRIHERQTVQPYQEAHERVLRQIENSDGPRFRQKAQEVSDELAKLAGKKAFALIIDDDGSKTMHMREQIEASGKRFGINYVIRDERDGNEGIVFYEEFAKLTPDEAIVIFMDGNLSRYDTGPLVTERLLEATKRHNLKLPFMVGASGDTDKNEDMRDLNPDIFIGFFYTHQDDNKINPHEVLAQKL